MTNQMCEAEAKGAVTWLSRDGYKASCHQNIQKSWVVEVLDPVRSSMHGTQFVQTYLKNPTQVVKFINERS